MDGLVGTQEMCIVCLATVASRHYTLCTPTPLPAVRRLVSSRSVLMLKLHPMIIYSTIGCIVCSSPWEYVMHTGHATDTEHSV